MERSAWSVSEYIDILQTKSTKNNYYSHLKQFFEHVYREKVPRGDHDKVDELSLRYWHDNRDYEKDLASYHSSLEGKAPKTKVLKIGAVKAYFEINRYTFSKVILQTLNGRKSNTPISRERVPSKEELQRILEHLPFHGRVITLVLTSSDMRTGEALNMETKDIDFNISPVKVYLKAKTTKTGQQRFTYISIEATEILTEWLKYRPTFIEKTASAIPIETSRKKYLKRVQNLVFPFSHQNLMKLWKSALQKTGLYEIDPDTNRVTIRPHNLRKYFRTYGGWANPDIPEALMGHRGGIAAVYARFDQAENILMEGYLEAEPNLSIYQSTATVLDLRDKVDKQSENLKELITSISLENVYLKKEIESLKTRLHETNQEIGTLHGVMFQTRSVQQVLLMLIERIGGETIGSILNQQDADHVESLKALLGKMSPFEEKIFEEYVKQLTTSE